MPGPARARAKHIWCRAQAVRAQVRWAGASPAGPLDATELDAFARRYPVRPARYEYSADDVLARGRDRRAELLPYVGAGGAVLEIGSADGMTAGMLAQAGFRATAIDLDTSRTDARARAAGVAVIEMDATRLDFPDAAFDLVYSFNVFEHLPDPASTFAEIARVLRPGGVVCVTFTGLRWSPHGAHLYKQIGVPYVTVLFEEGAVLDYLRRDAPVTPPWVNDYSIERFRSVFRAHEDVLSTLRYRETRNLWHAGLIAEYPGVFKARAPSFESLIVDSVHIVCRKNQ